MTARIYVCSWKLTAGTWKCLLGKGIKHRPKAPVLGFHGNLFGGVPHVPFETRKTIDVNGKSHTCLSHINVPGLLPYRGCLNQLLTQKYTHCSDHIRGHPRKKTTVTGCFPSHETGYPTVFFSKLGVLNDFTMCFLLFIVSAWKLHSWRLSKYEPSIQELYLHFPKQHQDTWLTLNGWPASTNPRKLTSQWKTNISKMYLLTKNGDFLSC